MLHGRILDRAQLHPIAGAQLRVTGPAERLRNVPGAQLLPATGAPTWSRVLTGFHGTRWQCWVAHVRDQVPGIGWAEFRDQALLYNPQLAADGRLFRAEREYRLPATSSAAPVRWTRMLTNFRGTRWQCWEAHVRDKVPGIGWAEFRDQALLYNPQLVADGRLFRADREYLLPQTDPRPWMELTAASAADGSFQLALAPGGPIDLQVHAEGYAPDLRRLDLSDPQAPLACLVLLDPTESHRSGSIRSALAGYSALPTPARALIDAALFLLGDDRQTYDALPPDWRPRCFGHRYATQPEHQHAKDIACADVVTIAHAAAGCALPKTNLFLADSYHPTRLGALGIELGLNAPRRPGDILVFGNGAPDSRAGHVALYVGPFWGNDRSNTAYPLAAGFDVVEGSLAGPPGEHPGGRGVIGVTLAQCLQRRRGYEWVRAVRLRAFGST